MRTRHAVYATRREQRAIPRAYCTPIAAPCCIPLPPPFPTLRISLDDTVAFISPMFHAMSWGMPYCAPAMGSKLVMPGQKVDGESLHRLFEDQE